MTTILTGDCRDILPTLPDESVQCCVTSPPYYGLRDYDVAGQIGLEKTPDQYIRKLVWIFREVRRVLKKDGTLWLNLGDSFTRSGKGGNPASGKQSTNRGSQTVGTLYGKTGEATRIAAQTNVSRHFNASMGLKPKDLMMIPARVAMALQDDGWWLRSDIVWNKPNAMPESVTDRPTRSHEFIFLMTKMANYYYDAAAIRENPSPSLIKQIEEGYNGNAVKDYLGSSVQDASAAKSRIIKGYRNRIDKQRGHSRRHSGFNDKWDALTPEEQALCGSNKRDVWTIAPANFKEEHFATFPPALIKPCIMAGSRHGDTILDPFGGSCTTGMVATELGRKSILIELNPEYVKLGQTRTNVTVGLPI